MSVDTPVLRVRELRKTYVTGSFPRRHRLEAVAGIDLDLIPGRTTALVGESGSGKSTLARCLLGLTSVTSGSMVLDGVELATLRGDQRRSSYRAIQMVFQDPHASLNPRRTVMQTIEEPLYHHLGMTQQERRMRAAELIDLVQLQPIHLERYPHELSGGQRQRVGIARALAVRPKVVVLDEPTSSLDVSVRAHIVDLLVGIQSELGLSYLFITHDLAVVRRMADDVHVMNRGAFVESGPAPAVFENPQHDYTRTLLDAIPVPGWDPSRRRASRLASAALA